MKRTLITLIAAVMCVFAVDARQMPRSRVAPPPRMHIVHHSTPHIKHHIHHRSWIAPTIIGSAMLGAAIVNATAPKTVIVEQPIVEKQVIVQQPVVLQKVQVLVPGHYEDQIQANGTVVRVWIPAHYELRDIQ